MSIFFTLICINSTENEGANERWRERLMVVMNELSNSTNIVIGKLGKLVHKQNGSHDFFNFFFNFMNYSIIIVQVRQKNFKNSASVAFNSCL
jgi:hypothetical protein